MTVQRGAKRRLDRLLSTKWPARAGRRIGDEADVDRSVQARTLWELE